jgi:hypothetical protein
VKKKIADGSPIEESLDALESLHRNQQLDIFHSNFSWTLLMLACHYERTDYVNWLLDHEASPHIRTQTIGSTALHFIENSVRCAALLLNAGANINVCDKMSHTPLDNVLCGELAYGGSADVVKYLLDRGAQTSRSDIENNEFYAAFISGRITCRSAFISGRITCRSACLAVVSLSKCKEASTSLRGNGRDVLGIVARLVWLTRGDEVGWGVQ